VGCTPEKSRLDPVAVLMMSRSFHARFPGP
jgi:hypothetical protein